MKKNGTNNHNQMGVDSDAEIMGACCVCEAVWDRNIGKKKCDTCAVPVLMCQSCCTEMGAQKKSHGSQLQGRFRLIRCPLCQKQKCTTRASDLEFTENGKKTKSKDEGASATVCKWGGGHSKKKAALRKEILSARMSSKLYVAANNLIAIHLIYMKQTDLKIGIERSIETL